ncbi:Alg9-like mannosyltransferase family-domain-containing protein [Umbelopsis sp. PMI_123]|nr:Alg9-like mannosyltransferase family-domain-containing protein [Umbelopsis sp. PMI_123]
MTLRSQRYIYILLVVLRLIFSLLPSYIQPDEYFQSPEITAGSIFDLEIFTPWEFDSAFPARSIVPPLLTTGLPFYVYKLALRLTHGNMDTVFVSGKRLYILERLSFFCMSFLLDLCIVKLCRLCKFNALRSLIMLSSSYVMLTYQCHSFSNSVEAVVLAISIALLFMSYPLDEKVDPSALASFALGICLAFGLFTRITFASFGIFIGVTYLYMTWSRSLEFRLSTFMNNLFPFALGMTLSILTFTVIDSIYFGRLKVIVNDSTDHIVDLLHVLISPSLWTKISFEGKLISTLFNNILYNVDKDNLELHGLHPYYLHAAVNVPLLFGPVGLWAYYKLFGILRGRFPARLDLIDIVLMASISTGLLCLSAFPHQEPRFLSPMLLPVVFLFTRHTQRLSSIFWIVWIIFNLVLGLVFGLLHQGGVVPAVIHVGEQSKHLHGCDIVTGIYAMCESTSGNDLNATQPIGNTSLVTNLVFYKTFMPPRHLMAYPHEWRDSANIVINVIDLAGGPIDKVKAALEFQTYIPMELVPADTSKPIFIYKPSTDTYERTLLIMPGTANQPIESDRLQRIARFWPHVNFDDIDKVVGEPSIEAISLSVYQLVSPHIT